MPNTRVSASARRLIAFCVFLFAANFAFAADRYSHHSLWAVKGKHNTVYLFGSIHLLSAGEQLPPEVDTAYRDADKLLMEIDMDDLDLLAAQKLTMELGMFPQGETLAEQLSPEENEQLGAYANRLGIPPTILQRFKPWFAAVTLTQLQFQKLGLDPQSGIEQRFVAKAAADHKEILGLETLGEQLKLLADLPPALQRQFLRQTIAEADQAEKEIGAILAAWRTGDTAALEGYVTRGMRDFPELYRPLTVERNHRWLTHIEKLLGAERNYMVIVGVLHLVGDDGLLDLLNNKNYKIEQQ